jgi:hypothetical protein
VKPRIRLNPKLGYLLMKDGRVPRRAKGLSIALALLITVMVEALELPVEGILAASLPVVGIVGDGLVDFAELLGLPILFSCLLLPFLTPRQIVNQIRQEQVEAKVK